MGDVDVTGKRRRGGKSGEDDKKKRYAEELRRQMEDQRRAKVRERDEYMGSPAKAAKAKVDAATSDTHVTPIRRAEPTQRFVLLHV